MTTHRIAAWLACLLLVGVGSVANADSLMDDFEDPDFTEELWEPLQGDWESQDGWRHGFSPAVGAGAFALFSDIETHDGLRIQVTVQHVGGAWQNGYIIFVYWTPKTGYEFGRGYQDAAASATPGGLARHCVSNSSGVR